ncbi:hypothetical protein V5799_021762 [Amblyomma americanum]|uniref:RING-type domain-containing protein n=1 Tax=Amblyomma americanum TaxID=6943 RepID=A0AAQ4FMJ1_AMBAM
MDHVPSTSKSRPGVGSSVQKIPSTNYPTAQREDTAEFRGRWHILRGYCSLLDGRPIPFRQPLPDSLVCSACQEVVPTIRMLPCGHSMCFCCLDMLITNPGHVDYTGVCPEDDVRFTARDVQKLQFSLEHLMHLEVCCPNLKFGCAFQCKLRELLNRNLVHCTYHPKSCDHSQWEDVHPRDVVQHWNACSGSPEKGNDSGNDAVGENDEAASSETAELVVGNPLSAPITNVVEEMLDPIIDKMKKILDLFKNTVQGLCQAHSLEELTKLLELLDRLSRVIDNDKGSLSSTYPGRIVSLALPSQGTGDETADSNAHKLRTEKLRGHMEKARVARARTRFAVPVILYDGKNICRSATLSGGLEIYGRTIIKFLETAGGSDAAAASGGRAKDEEAVPEKDDSASDEAGGTLHGELRREDILLLQELSVGQICDLMVEGKKAKYNMNVTSSEKVDKWNRYQDFTIFKLPYPGCEFFEQYKNKEYKAEGLVFDWDQHFIDVDLNVPEDVSSELGIDWTMYKIFFFCFNMLKYIDTEEFSVVSLSPIPHLQLSRELSPKKIGGATMPDVPDRPPSGEISSEPKSPLSLAKTQRRSSGSSTLSSGSWHIVDEAGSENSGHELSPKKRKICGDTDESTSTTDGTMPRTKLGQRRRERLREVRRLVSSAYQCVMADKINEASRGSYWASSLFSVASSLLWQGGASGPSN